MKINFMPLGLLMLALSGLNASASWENVSSSSLDQSFSLLASTSIGILYAFGNAYNSGKYGELVLASSSDFGRTWQESDRLRDPSRFNLYDGPSSVFVSKSGDLFELATMNVYTDSTTHWVIRKTESTGKFKQVDDVVAARNFFFLGGPADMAQNSSGTLFVAGTFQVNTNESRTLIRTSDASGENWKTLSTLPQTNAYSTCRADKIAIDKLDTLYVGQTCFDDGDTRTVWTEIYESKDSGSTWKSLDDIILSTTGSAPSISSILFTLSGDVIYSISMPDWTVRMHNHQTGEWKTTDHFLCGAPNDFDHECELNALMLDSVTQQIWAIGSKFEKTAPRWITRVSADGGLTWTENDSIPGEGFSLVQDALGNIYAAGNDIDRRSTTIRKLVR